MATATFNLLERDHAEISELFERVHSPDEDRPMVLKDLVQRLATHVAVEEAVVAPELRHADDSDLKDELSHDYHVIQHNLVLIERRKANSPDMPELVTEMHDTFTAHVERCQQRLYPDLEGSLDGAQLNDLAARIKGADDVVVHHPHPHLLSLGPLSRFTTRLAGKLDKAEGVAAWGGLRSTPNDNSTAPQQPDDGGSDGSPPSEASENDR
jgi:hypothetical protein